MELLLDMHKYDGVNVLKCGLECDNLINRGLDRKPFLFSFFDSFIRKGLAQFPLFLWIPVSYCNKEKWSPIPAANRTASQSLPAGITTSFFFLLFFPV